MDYSVFREILLNQARYYLGVLAGYRVPERLVIVVIYAVLAKVADLFIDHLLKSLANRTHSDLDNRMIDFLHRPICWSIFLLGTMHAVSIQPALVPPWNMVVPNLIKTLILLVWWVSLIREITLMNEENMGWVLSRMDRTHFFMLKNVSRIVILFTGILWGLVIWKVNLTPLFASAGIVGIAIALAARDTLANFFGGIALFVDAAYKVGDYIILDSGERGEVVEVGIRSTKIQTRDDVMITIPNSIMSSTKIINESAPQPRFRIRIDVSVAYGSDLRRVEKTLLRVARANQALAEKPEPRVRVRSFGDSAINFQLLVWVRDPRHKGLETHNLLKMIYAAFADQDIEIPFPQRDVHLKAVDASEADRDAEEQPLGTG
ncbi:mechanosensitive ion channel family protein [Thermodesulfobacteriota bacterium B35]